MKKEGKVPVDWLGRKKPHQRTVVNASAAVGIDVVAANQRDAGSQSFEGSGHNSIVGITTT